VIIGIDSYNADADTSYGNELLCKSERKEMAYISINHYKLRCLCIHPLTFSKINERMTEL
jgi:hypothetical protein